MKLSSSISILLIIAILLTGCQFSQQGTLHDYNVTEENFQNTTDTIESTDISNDELELLYTYAAGPIIEIGRSNFTKYVTDPELLDMYPFTPALYTYTSDEGKTVYLFGTSQVYDPETAWFPAYVQDALEQANIFITAHPEMNYATEELAYAVSNMQYAENQYSSDLIAIINQYCDIYDISSPSTNEVQPIYWYLTMPWGLSTTPMNNILWDMAEEKTRIMAYSGNTVIDRLLSLSKETETALTVSGLGTRLSTYSITKNAIEWYYSWLICGAGYKIHADYWWDNHFYCSGDDFGDNWSNYIDTASMYNNTGCDGTLCAETHFPNEYEDYYNTVFHPNCHDILQSIYQTDTKDSVFVAVDWIYLTEIATDLVLNGYIMTQRLPMPLD